MTAGEGYHVPGSEVVHLDEGCPHLGHANDFEEVEPGEIQNYRICTLCDHDLDEKIRQLAVKIEKKIAENQEYIEQLPDFEPRSSRSKKVRSMRNGV